MNVFLSYSAQDKQLADDVLRTLTSCGFEVWSDEVIRPGESLSANIGIALKKADAFVILLTRNASRSKWALLELGGAMASGKPVVPVLAEPGAEVPLVLRDRQYLDLSAPGTRSQALERLCEVLRESAKKGSMSDLRDGIELVENARSALARERSEHEVALWEQSQSYTRMQAVIALFALVAAAVALLTASVSDTAVLALVVSGVGSALASALGFLLGSKRRRDRS